MKPVVADQLYRDALTVLGVRRNHLKLIEEASELSAAVARLILGRTENDDEVLIESVDLWICIEIEIRRFGERWRPSGLPWPRNHHHTILACNLISAATAELLSGHAADDSELFVSCVEAWRCLEAEREHIGVKRWEATLCERQHRLAVRVLAAQPMGEVT